MPYRIVIDFGAPTQTLTHRVRNFGEDIYRESQRTGEAAISLSDIDGATNRLSLTVRTTRHLGTATALIKKTLKRHLLDDTARITQSKL